MGGSNTWLLLGNMSDVSKRAFWFATQLIDKQTSDSNRHMYVVNVQEKETNIGLPTGQYQDHIKTAMSTLCSEAETRFMEVPSAKPRIHYTVRAVNRPSGGQIHDVALKFVDRHNIDYVVLGSGRCNRKDSVGSVAYNTMKALSTAANACSVLVVKSQYRDKVHEQFTTHKCHFLVCVDGSEAAEFSFDRVAKFKKDAVFTCIFMHPDPDDPKARQIKRNYEVKLKQNDLYGKVEVRSTTGMTSSNAAALVDIANEIEADVIAVGCERKSSKSLGSVTKYLAKHAQRHVLVTYMHL